MMRRSSLAAAAVLACAGSWSMPAAASMTRFDLQPPTAVGNLVEVAVWVDFTPDHGDELVSFLVNTAGSSSTLTGGGADYTRFAFALDPALAADWAPVAGFGAAPGRSFAQFDTFTAGLGAGSHLLGLLRIDTTGLPAGADLVVMIANVGAPNATGGVSEVPGQPPTAALTDVSFAADDQGTLTFRTPGPLGPPPAIPEPACAWLALLGVAGIACRAAVLARRAMGLR
jgi:hypothetical protein